MFSILLHVIQHQVAENIYKFAVLWASSTKTWAESVVSTASLCVWIAFRLSNVKFQYLLWCPEYELYCFLSSVAGQRNTCSSESHSSSISTNIDCFLVDPQGFEWQLADISCWVLDETFFWDFQNYQLSITTIFLWSLDLALFPNTTSRWSNLLYLYSNSYKQVFDYSLSVYLIYSNLTVCFKTLLLIFGNNILHVIDFILEKQPLFGRVLIWNCIFICFRHV